MTKIMAVHKHLPYLAECEMMWCIRWHFCTILHSQENSAIGRWNPTFWPWSREQIHIVHSDSTVYSPKFRFWLVSLSSHWNTNILKCSCRKDRPAWLMVGKLQHYNWGCAVAWLLLASLSLQRPGFNPKPGYVGFVVEFSLPLTVSFHPCYVAYFCQYHSTNIM